MSPSWPYLAPVPAGPGRDRAPSIGVLVTAHEVARFLPAALASVFCQSRLPDQVVVCDDASTDDVEGAVAPYADRLTFLRREVNGGEGAAKNTAVAALTTDLVVVLDGDDEMAPTRLEALEWLACERSDLDLLTTEWEEFGPGAAGSGWSLAAHFPVVDQRRAVLRWNFLPAPAIRRAPLLAAGGFDETLRYGPDWELYARMILRGSRAGLVTRPLYRYRQWGGQQTADRRRVLDGRVDVVSTIARDAFLDDADRKAVAESLARARGDRWSYRLAAGVPDRREALWLLRAPHVSRRRRALAALATASPRLGARVLRDRSRSPG